MIIGITMYIECSADLYPVGNPSVMDFLHVFIARNCCKRVYLLVTALSTCFLDSSKPSLRGVVKDKHSAVDSVVWRRWLELKAELRVVGVVVVHKIAIVGGGGQKE